MTNRSQITTALAATGSFAAQSLLSLGANVRVGLDKGASAASDIEVWACNDPGVASAAIPAAGMTSIGVLLCQLSGADPNAAFDIPNPAPARIAYVSRTKGAATSGLAIGDVLARTQTTVALAATGSFVVQSLVALGGSVGLALDVGASADTHIEVWGSEDTSLAGAAIPAAGLDASGCVFLGDLTGLDTNQVFNLPNPPPAAIVLASIDKDTATSVFATGLPGGFGSGDVNNGGNAYGAAMSVGTTDAQSFSLISAGVARITLGATGAITVLGANGQPVSIKSGTGAGATVELDSGGVGAINIGIGAADKVLTLGSVIGSSNIAIKGGTAGVTVTPTGPIQSQAGTNHDIDCGNGGLLTVGVAPQAKTIVIGNVTSTTSVTLNAGTNGVSLAATGGGKIRLTPGATGSVELQPRAVGAGNTTRLDFLELAANGTNRVSFQAPDSLAGNTDYLFPTTLPTVADMSLTSTVGGVLSWKNSIQSGNAAIVNGISAAIPANIAAGSLIFVQAHDTTPGAGNLTIGYQPLTANRVNGTPGSFRITATLADGSFNVLDQTASVHWMVLNP